MSAYREWINGLVIAAIVCFSSAMFGKCVTDPHPSSIAQQYWQQGHSLEKQRNYAAAIPLFIKAADLGDACGQLSLGFVYANGLGIQRDYERAVYWWRKAADQENAAAEYSLGLMYGQGKGVPAKDSQIAIMWLERAAKHGDRTAMGTLGLTYSGCKLDRLDQCKTEETSGVLPTKKTEELPCMGSEKRGKMQEAKGGRPN